jgi:hypothetical protein
MQRKDQRRRVRVKGDQLIYKRRSADKEGGSDNIGERGLTEERISLYEER